METNPSRLRCMALFSHAPEAKGVFRFYESPSLFLRPFVYS